MQLDTRYRDADTAEVEFLFEEGDDTRLHDEELLVRMAVQQGRLQWEGNRVSADPLAVARWKRPRHITFDRTERGATVIVALPFRALS